MKMRAFLATASLATLLSLLPSAAARAQMGPAGSGRLISFGIGGGLSVPANDAADALKSGVNGQAFACVNLPGLPIRPRVDVTFQHFDLKQAQVVSPVATPGGTGTLLAGVANVQVPLHHGFVEPYVVAGVGAYQVKADDGSGSASGTVSRTHFGVNGGAGVRVKLTVVSLYVEGRVDNVYSDQGVIDAKSIQVVPVSFGLVY